GWNADAGSITPGVGSVPGFLGPRELTEHYATITGADVSRVDYYVAFANWRLACIAVGVRHRYRSGVMGDDGFAPDALDLEINQLGEATLVGLTE
ncbi:hypothetical protein, partial [Enterococcus faecium]|uniref:hypothetical protein n=1 Tax=Enterococcus faecium TaxID=1352 RepID=UPI0034E94EBA